MSRVAWRALERTALATGARESTEPEDDSLVRSISLRVEARGRSGMLAANVLTVLKGRGIAVARTRRSFASSSARCRARRRWRMLRRPRVLGALAGDRVAPERSVGVDVRGAEAQLVVRRQRPQPPLSESKRAVQVLAL